MQISEISEDQLDAIYKYLSISFENMEEGEKRMWTLLLMIADPEFDDDQLEEEI